MTIIHWGDRGAHILQGMALRYPNTVVRASAAVVLSEYTAGLTMSDSRERRAALRRLSNTEWALERLALVNRREWRETHRALAGHPRARRAVRGARELMAEAEDLQPRTTTKGRAT